MLSRLSTSKLQQVAIATVVTISTVAIYRTIKNRRIRRKLENRGKQKRKELNEPQLLLESMKHTVNDEIRSKILSLNATQIRREIIDGNLKCIEVIITYCLECDVVNKRVNALLEKHYDSAIKDAQNMDKLIELKRNESSEIFSYFISNKPLLGIPISIKDVFEMKDSDSTNGILFCCNNKCKSDGSVLEVIRSNGGIPFCKTSVPQLLMMCENWNNIIGDTLNPYDINRSCGGSSGGEGAIIGGGGSILGVGGDIGGSLRIPAHFNGVIAYKPSTKRTLINGKIWCYKQDGKGRYTSKFGILPSVGPMAKSMDDIILFLKAMWSPKAFELDMYSAPIPFRDEMYISSYKKQLTIGYWINDGWFNATECIERAINLCVDGLQSKYEYKLIAMDFNDGAKVLNMYLRYMFAQGNMKKYINALRGEGLHAQFIEGKFYQDIPNMVKKYILNPILRLIGEERKAFISERAAINGGLTTKELEDEMYEIMKFRYEFWKWVDQYGDDDKIDCILSPICYFPALPIGFSRYLSTSLTSTFLQNILDCSAGSIGPITFVKHNECKYDLNKLPIKQRDSVSLKLNEFMKDAKGLPINVQIFGRPFHDEIVLRVMKELEVLFVNKK